jgi:sec-independent protein translocase protein TatC
VALRIIFWSGLIISSPFIVLAVGAFVFPGLTPVEKGVVYRGACFAVAMFAVGVGVGYAVTLPMAVRLMLAVNRWMGVQAEFIELGDYVSFFLKLLLAFGLTFQLPVVVVALGYVGLVSSRQLRDGRRHVCVGLLVLAMILTPPDPLTQLVMALPLVALYEGCIWLVWMHERRHAGT